MKRFVVDCSLHFKPSLSLSKISTFGKDNFFFTVKGPIARGNLMSACFLKLIKCSFSAVNLYMINSSANNLNIRNTGRAYG